MNRNFLLSLLVFMTACNSNTENKKQEMKYKSIGTIERLDPALDDIISADAKPEIIAEGFEWSEGPLWVEQHNMFLFSDVPMNTIYKWTEAKGKEVYLKPSGYTGTEPSVCKEPGSNGLTFDKNGDLVLCQHGDRRMARMDAPLDKPEAKFITLANTYNGKRFSSPNDAVYNSAGELFFTDPPYGLQTQDDSDTKKEISFNGVYEVNGDSLTNGKIFYNAAEEGKTMRGLPDGFKIDKNGNIFASGPGGIYIFNSEAKKLGMIKLENAASNCALSTDEKTLYITNDMYVLRVKLRD